MQFTLDVAKGLDRADSELLWQGLMRGLAPAAGLRDPLDAKLPLLTHELLTLHTEDLRGFLRAAFCICCTCSCCCMATTIGVMAPSVGSHTGLVLLC